MQIILIPGFWLDGDSWGGIAADLEAAGHAVTAVTLPGKRSGDTDLAGIGLRTHVDAVLEIVDAIDEPVVLVGHSGGGTIAWAVTDARPDRIARVVFVDAIPMPSGSVINDELPVEGDAVPLPDWSVFEPEDLIDLEDELRAHFRAIAVPEPKGVAHEPTQLDNEARFAVPVTIIACQFPAALVQQAIGNEREWAAEVAGMQHLELVELPTGHWPQFTRPAELARSIRAAVER
ncbi:MAG: alpha/beta hydrolase [Microbacterium sp.]|nr:alpha/beta hydrolase [Microbacterium sp.]MBA4346103.1 alpha/beta hydrolase [Microbacterium sp.]